VPSDVTCFESDKSDRCDVVCGMSDGYDGLICWALKSVISDVVLSDTSDGLSLRRNRVTCPLPFTSGAILSASPSSINFCKSRSA
jgi:hypothetical protein